MDSKCIKVCISPCPKEDMTEEKRCRVIYLESEATE